jgi:hypothetical protein
LFFFLEYAICTRKNIELFDSNWKQLNNSKFSIEVDGFTMIKSITYDVKNDVFYFAENQKFKAGIYKLKVHNETSYEISNFNVNRNDEIRDLVIDSVEDTLYWSDAENKKIFRLKLSPLGKVEVFLDVSYDIEGLEIDTCGRKLFFVKKYTEKLNFVSLDDPKRVQTEVGSGNHQVPHAIAIDHQNRRLYVADHTKSVHYSIDSILANGSDFRTEIDDDMKTPRSIAVDKDFVYYVDGSDHHLMRFKKEYDGKKKTSEILKTFKNDPQDIIVRSNFVRDLDSEVCKAKKVEPKKPLELQKNLNIDETSTKTSQQKIARVRKKFAKSINVAISASTMENVRLSTAKRNVSASLDLPVTAVRSKSAEISALMANAALTASPKSLVAVASKTLLESDAKSRLKKCLKTWT